MNLSKIDPSIELVKSITDWLKEQVEYWLVELATE